MATVSISRVVMETLDRLGKKLQQKGNIIVSLVQGKHIKHIKKSTCTLVCVKHQRETNHMVSV